jgi:hypothetical protein
MKLLTIKNIRFFKNRKLLAHNDTDRSLADTVSITFEFQKRETRNEIITQHRTDSLLCPIRL